MRARGGAFLVVFAAALAGGCAKRAVVAEAPADVTVPCPDDGVHFVVNGVCLAVKSAPAIAPVPCPNDGRHERVNGICVDVLGK